MPVGEGFEEVLEQFGRQILKGRRHLRRAFSEGSIVWLDLYGNWRY